MAEWGLGHTRAGVNRLRRLDHLVRRRRGEDLAGASGIEHAEADEARMQRLVPRTAAGNQRDLAGLERAAADEFTLGAKQQDIGMGGGETIQAFLEQTEAALKDKDLQQAEALSNRALLLCPELNPGK